MKVLLINPPRLNELIGKDPAIIVEHGGYNPPLGLLSLAGYLELHSDHQVEILDAQPDLMSYDMLAQEIALRSCDIVGITAMTFTLIDVMKTVRIVKEVHPHVKVVLGGPHVHIFPNETIGQPGVDFLVQGEGEIAFLELLNNIDNVDAFGTEQGLVFERDGEIINNGIAPLQQDLDKLGFPARHLIDVTKYTSLLGKQDMVTTMFTSRGCPFRCTFCDRPFSPVISGFRARSAVHVVEEIEQCIAMGISEAIIYDDTFTVRKDRVFELCEEILARNINFTWNVRAHVNTVTPDMLKLMRRAGCNRIHYGVEAGNDRMLKEIKKNTKVSQIKEAVEWAKEAGMEVLTYFIIGQQTETRKDIEDTIALAKSLKPNFVHFTIFCPYPATEIYELGLAEGIIKEDVWRKFAENPVEGFELPFWEENFTREKLLEMLVKCYKGFYLRPAYILKNVARIRSVGEFRRKMKAGMSVASMTAVDKLSLKPNIRRKVQDVVPQASYNVHC